MDVLSLMFEATRRGYLQVADKPASPEQVARMTGGSVDEVSRLLQELLNAGALSRTDDGTIYSRRQVREEEERAATRTRVAKHRTACNGACNGEVTALYEDEDEDEHPPPDLPLVLSYSDSERGRAQGPSAFDAFWAAYPTGFKNGEKVCRAKWKALGLDGKASEVMAGLAAWQGSQRWQDGFVVNMTVFLNQERWKQAPPAPRGIPATTAPKYETDGDRALRELRERSKVTT